MIQKSISLMLVILLATVSMIHARPVAQSDPPIPVDEIIKRFSEKEKAFKAARANYTYREVVSVEELTADDRVRGKFEQTSDIGFDSNGKRTTKVIFAPVSTLVNLSMTPQDFADIESIQPFVLTSDDIAKYKLTYKGTETVDQVGTYVFEVEPKKIEKDQRYFQGRIWVDDRDFQIVKTYGKAVPDIMGGKNKDNLFPRFETYREQIDGKFWFPTYTRAVDTLNFQSGPQKIRQIIKYQNYKRFGANINLTFGDAVDENGKSIPPADNKAPALPKK